MRKIMGDRIGRSVNIALGLLAVVLGTAARPVRADAVYTWGYNISGQLGDGTTTQRNSPVALTGLLSSGVTASAGGSDDSLAVQNGAVYAWGYNLYGEVGDGTTTQRNTPIALTGPLSSGVTAIAGGTVHSLAVQNGGVYAWGLNSSGQLGDGTTTERHTPVALNGPLSSGVTAIAGGYVHSVALQNGGVYAWGDNSSGQLGDGTTTQRNSPVALAGPLSSGVTTIAAGYLHSLAVQNGSVYAWGDNSSGQLGDGTTTRRTSPVTLTGSLSSGVTAIAGGFYHSLAVRNGGVYAWGGNSSGELGDGTTTDHSTPEQIDPTDLSNIVAVAASAFSSYALSSDGSLWTWGFNGYGELGLGNTTSYKIPQHLLPPLGYSFTSIDANANGLHAVATLTATPEPASLSLIALGAGALLARRRR